jgi:DNA-binding GntR family transcriptional regulator
MSSIAEVRTVIPEQIITQLRVDIMTGKYRKGERLTEAELAANYAVSRGPIRVVLQTLESEGFIETLPNGRKEVTGFSAKQVKDIYDLRWMLEKRAAECIFAERSRFLSPVLNVLHKVEDAVMRNDEDEADWFNMDIQFHRALVAASGNRALLKAWDINSPIMYALLALNTTKDYREQYIREFYGKHKKIFDFVVAADNEVFDYLRIHISDAEKLSTERNYSVPQR